MNYYIGKTISTDDLIFGWLDHDEKENQLYIIEVEDEQLSWAVENETVRKVWFEVNTCTDDNGNIATSNTFTDYFDALEFYDSINDEKKEFLLVDCDGNLIKELQSNYGH